MDVWGPAQVKSLGGKRYFCSIIDDYFRYANVFFMSSKAEVFDLFKEYQRRVECEFDRKIKAIHTDQGLEYCSKAFENKLMKEGIGIQRTNTYTPEQNGVAERFNRTIIESTRCAMIEGNLPKEFWAEAANAEVYLMNRREHKRLKKHTPYELWVERKSSVRHLKSIGCLAYVHVPKQKRNKLDAPNWGSWWAMP